MNINLISMLSEAARLGGATEAEAEAIANTIVEAVEGQEHNRTGRRRRVEAIEQLTLTMRQEQAGEALA